MNINENLSPRNHKTVNNPADFIVTDVVVADYLTKIVLIFYPCVCDGLVQDK